MPYPRVNPTVVLATASRAKKGKGASTKARRYAIQGRRTGFAAPAPSRVPVGALETKVQRQARRTLQPNSAGTIVTLNGGIQQGTKVYERIGHKFKTTACRIKGYFFNDIDGSRAAIVGYVWVWDKSPNGVAPAVSDIFTVGVGNGYDMSNTLLVDDNSDRFKVLKSVRKTMSKTQGLQTDPGQQGTTGNGANIILIDDYLKLPAWAVTSYKKGVVVPTVADHQTGALYLVPFSVDLSSGTGGVTPIAMDFTTEVFFAEA